MVSLFAAVSTSSCLQQLVLTPSSRTQCFCGVGVVWVGIAVQGVGAKVVAADYRFAGYRARE